MRTSGPIRRFLGWRTPDERIVAALSDHTSHNGFSLCVLTRLGTGAVYPALQRLEDEGIIASGWDEAATGRRPRRYWLVEAGK